MLKSTLGPWTIERSRSGTVLSIGPCVADEYAGRAWLDVTEEDAKLIAAAPLLLEALLVLDDVYQDAQFNAPEHRTYAPEAFDEAWKKARAAIASAEGKL